MKRLLQIIILFHCIFSLINVYAQDSEEIIIGICPPYKLNENATTMFYHKQFLFEFFSQFSYPNIKIEIIYPDSASTKDAYKQNAIDLVLERSMDYLIFSTTSTADSYLFFKIHCINPYTEEIIVSDQFVYNIDYTVNESLSLSINQFITSLLEKPLPKNKGKTVKEKDNKDLFKEYKYTYRHEFFILEGFLKNHPAVMSMLHWYLGYSFAPYNFLRLEAGFLWGGGYRTDKVSLKSFNLNKFYLGGAIAVYFAITNFIEPVIGPRLEFTYIIKDEAFISIPVDLGLRINFRTGHSLRFDTSFQFICYSLSEKTWKNKYTIGFMVGYARKI